MSVADLLTGTLAEEIAAQPQLRVYVPTSPATGVAVRAAKALGAEHLAIVEGFTKLDGDQRDWVLDVFTLLRKGWLGVAITPIQLDTAGRTNLSGLGAPGALKTALIGPRGLPDNNDTPCPLWYLLPAHSDRTLVSRVDIVCGPAPSGLGQRTLLTPAGCFDLVEGAWRARWLTSGGADLVAAVPTFPIAIPDGTPTRDACAAETLGVLETVDAAGARRREFGEAG